MEFNHGLPPNRYNPHCWICGEPEIGEGTWIGAFTVIDGLGGLKIGKGCDISSGAKIMSHSSVLRCLSERVFNQLNYAATEIGDSVFIGTNAVILMGAKIGHHSVVAAGAVVLEHTIIPPYSLVAGVPATFRRSLEREVQNLKTNIPD